MKLKFLLVCALSVYSCWGIDEQRSCDEQCSPTYPLHTYPQTDHYTACTRGCRLAYLGRYTSDGSTSCNKTCYEAYTANVGAAYACSVGCGVSVDMSVNDEIAEVSVMNNLMDVLFVTRVMDMLSPNDDGNPRGNVEEWGEEVDVYLSEDLSATVNASATGDATDVRWNVYSFVWFFDSGPSHVTTSTQVEGPQESDPTNGYYLVYYKQWSLTQASLFPQLICYVTLFLFIMALLKCCHMLVYESNDGTDEGLSIRADNGYESNGDDDDDDDEMMALLQKKRQQYMTGIVHKPPHTEHMLVSVSSLLPVQNTKLYNGGKVEGILTVV